jgi:5-methylcytosine-specific restriction endonuclease McrA
VIGPFRGLVLEGDDAAGVGRTAPRGVCRLCAGPILDADGRVNRRRRWHQLCTDYVTVVLHSQWTLAAFRRIDGRLRCYACGFTNHDGPCEYAYNSEGWRIGGCVLGEHRGWEVDHVVPLWAGGSHGFANLQTLCYPCHRDKTAREAALRAARRRAQLV